MSERPPYPRAFERDLISSRVSLNFGSKREADAFCLWFIESYGEAEMPDQHRHQSRDLRVLDQPERTAKWWRQHWQHICNPDSAA